MDKDRTDLESCRAVRTILITGYFFFPTGSAAAERLRSYALALRDEGFKVYVLTSARIKHSSEEWCELEKNIWYSSVLAGKQRKNPLSKALGQFRGAWRMFRQLRCFAAKPDLQGVLVYERRFVGLLSIALALKDCPRRILIESVEWFLPSHFHLGWCNPRWWDELLGRNFIARQPWTVIAISQFIASKYRKKNPAPCIVPAIVDLDSNPPVRATASSGRTLRCAYIGGLKYTDGVTTILHALSRLRKRGLKVTLEIIGKPSDRLGIESFNKCLDAEPALRGQIELRGFVDENRKRDLLGNCQFLLLPRHENQEALAAFPTRLPELLLTEIPVITSAVGDVPQYLAHGEDAFLIRPGNVEDLVTIFREYLEEENREAYRRIGRKGRETAIRCFTPGPYCSELVQLFRENDPVREQRFSRVT